jgi:hypothetical protein
MVFLVTLKAKPSNTTQQIGVSRVVVSGSQLVARSLTGCFTLIL